MNSKTKNFLHSVERITYPNNKAGWDRYPWEMEESAYRISSAGDGGRVSEDELEKLYRSIKRLIENGTHLKDFPMKEFQKLPTIIFCSPGEKELLYPKVDLFLYIKTALERKKYRPVRDLFFELLRNMPEDRKIYKILRGCFLALKHIDEPGTQALAKKIETFSLCDKEGARKVAEYFYENIDKDIEENISNVGIPKLYDTEFWEKIILELCEINKRLLQKEEYEKSHFLRQFIKDFLDKNLGLELRIKIIESYLLPFDKKKCPKKMQSEISGFMDWFAGDPRVSENNWRQNEKERQIYMRWKTEKSLETFFKILSDNSKKSSVADRHWMYRKEFYEAYFEAGHLGNAHVVLGSSVEKIFKKYDEKGLLNYGRFISGGGSRAAILITIGDLIIWEWSSEGAALGWRDKGSDGAPELYEDRYKEYSSSDQHDIRIIHRDSEKYSWQKKLAQYIKDVTGIDPPDPRFKNGYY